MAIHPTDAASWFKKAGRGAGEPILGHVADGGRDGFLLLGRLALAAIFLPSGLAKLTHLGAFAHSLGAKGLPAPEMLAVIGAGTEFFGALALALGCAARYAALAMVLFTAAAALISHHFWTFSGAQAHIQYVQFMKNLAIIGGLLALFVAGPGRWSLDRPER
jgi:putative oxidoreductase